MPKTRTFVSTRFAVSLANAISRGLSKNEIVDLRKIALSDVRSARNPPEAARWYASAFDGMKPLVKSSAALKLIDSFPDKAIPAPAPSKPGAAGTFRDRAFVEQAAEVIAREIEEGFPAGLEEIRVDPGAKGNFTIHFSFERLHDGAEQPTNQELVTEIRKLLKKEQRLKPYVGVPFEVHGFETTDPLDRIWG